MSNLLSWLGAALSLATVYCFGSKYYRLAFILSMCSDPIWLFISLDSKLYGMAALAVITFVMNIRGLIKCK